MWCAKCQADVSTEVSADGQSINCTNCGSEIRRTQAPSLHPEMRRARQLIEQLQSEGVETDVTPDAPGTVKSDTAGTTTHRNEGGSAPESGTAKPQAVRATNPRHVRSQSIRVDGPHPTERGSHAPPPSKTITAGDSRAPGPERREDQPHLAVAAPHFDLAAIKPNAGKAESIWGQLLAYGGVAVLTVGTALVLWGHFGGPPQYAPTGWLVATAGQMLLFLGVVTLISGGMQQTTQQVTSRVEYIGNRMLRIEQTAEQLLRGPHFARAGQTAKATPGSGEDSAAAS